MKRAAFTYLLYVAVSASAIACEYYAEHFQIVHPWAPPAPLGEQNVAISLEFVEIASTDRLIGASTPIAERVEIVHSAERDAQERGHGILLLPGAGIALTPEGNHLVLRGLSTELHEGRQYPLTLTFEQAGHVYVEFVAGDH